MMRNLYLLSTVYLCATVLIIYSNKLVDYKFWSLYTLMFLLDSYFLRNENTRRLSFMIITSALVGFLIEYFGSNFGLWKFSSIDQPPLYVIFSWPLVFCLMYATSKMMYEWKA